MNAVVHAAGKGTPLRPLTEDPARTQVEVAAKLILLPSFVQLVDPGAEVFVIVEPLEERAISTTGLVRRYPNHHCAQREQRGLAYALLTVEELIDDEFMFMPGNDIFQANFEWCSQATSRGPH